ncbi:MAG: Yip1 family protein [Nitrososphaeraceae archaeon]
MIKIKSKTSLVDKRIVIIKDVITSPTKAFREIDANARYYFRGAIIILAIYGIISSFFYSSTLYEQLFKVQSQITGQSSQIQVLYILVYDFFYVVLVYYMGRRLKGSGNFLGIFSTLQYAGIPMLVGHGLFSLVLYNTRFSVEPSMAGVISAIFPYGVIMLPLGIWSFILSIFACRESHKVSGKRSIGILILSAVVLGIVAGIVTIATSPF